MSEVRVPTVDFDRLASSAPLNKQAAVDYAATGDSWSPERSFSNVRFDGPPPLRPLRSEHLKNPSFTDYTGRRFGRLRVLGMIDCAAAGLPVNDKVGAAWAVRCDCGAYEYRRARALKSHREAGPHACAHCHYLEELKAGRVQSKTVAERIAERLRP